MSKPSLCELTAACPGVDERLVREHLARLPDRYFARFSAAAVARHVRGLATLGPNHAVEVQTEAVSDRQVDVTVLAFDYGSLFALLAGVLSALAASIQSGGIFTYRAVEIPAARPRLKVRHRRDLRKLQDPFLRRRIVDHFRCELGAGVVLSDWQARLAAALQGVVGLLESGDRASVSQAKYRVNEMVAERLAALEFDLRRNLFPVRIEVDNDAGQCTRLRVSSEDTPVFLYALSNALSLRGVSIEEVHIQTLGTRIEDELDIVDARGRKIEDPDLLNQIRLSVLLTKHFTYFLGMAPEPDAALGRFETLLDDVLKLPEQGKWVDLLSNPAILQDLARLLGTSDFMWEDFVRTQYETLIPMLGPDAGTGSYAHPSGSLPELLSAALAGAATPTERKQRLNEFKDREIFLIDLDHILTPRAEFRTLATRLSALAEAVVEAAANSAFEAAVERYGRPRTVAGLEASYAILGLGKLGGAALGYASDIELLFVYDDNGRTDGASPVSNAEFFNRFVQDATQAVSAKRDGIFNIDLRLRPHGSGGPLAVSLESFCNYYGLGGPAHAYERLALVRLRTIGGSAGLGARVERLRDNIIYFSNSIDLAQLRDLRQKQFREKRQPGRVNAKFSPGALVDLEYDVQILQVMYGSNRPELQTPKLHEALAGLATAGVISPDESCRLLAAYDFLRHLINGLRMLRGNARDLFLPPVDADEFAHLARRMGYRRDAAMSPERQLHLDFDTYTATVRAFVERHFGRDSLPDPAIGNAADLVLAVDVPTELRDRILRHAGFADPERAFVNLRKLAAEDGLEEVFARLAVLACEMLRRMPDPDMALNNWERFVTAAGGRRVHFSALLSQPKRLEILLGIFAGSQFLADTLERNPEFLEWVTEPATIQTPGDVPGLMQELRALVPATPGSAKWLDRLRRFRRREILRIGARDICLHVAPTETMLELTDLAEAVVSVALEVAWQDAGGPGPASQAAAGPQDFCVMAFGKLGGGELNYSSDIDLLALCRDFDGGRPAAMREAYASALEDVMKSLRGALSDHTGERYAYRVDLRLRPYGSASHLVQPMTVLVDYYERSASLWEIQALLKMRPVAGNIELGRTFLQQARPVFLRRRDPSEVAASIRRMRDQALARTRRAVTGRTDVKTGLGGIREIEFLVQGLQVIHAPDFPDLVEGNTLRALEVLAERRILGAEATRELAGDYLFLRRVEHYLQLFEDRQTHALPSRPAELLAFAKRMSGANASADAFMRDVQACQQRVRTAYDRFLTDPAATV